MRAIGILILALLCQLSPAGDWPQFLGPDRSGTSAEAHANNWKAKEPIVAWKKPVGSGFAGPIVVKNQVFLFHREGNVEILESFDASTGASRWRNDQPTGYRDDFGSDEGPRAVPTWSDGAIFAMGAEGTIRSVNAGDGKLNWVVRTKDAYKSRKGFFGLASAPLVVDKRVVVNIGGEPEAGLIALDRESGKLSWKARNDEASYASPVIANFDGKPRIVAFTREAVCVLDPESGRQLSEFPWRSRMHASVNAATPIVSSNFVFVTASYDTGAALLEWTGTTLRKVWSNNDSLSSHYATPVLQDGFLYGFHGRQEYGPAFRCVEFRTGKVVWSQEGFGAGSLIGTRENLLILRESGELTLAKASPKGFVQLGNVQILGSGTRAYPALSGNRLFARDKNSLVCVTLP